MRPWQVQLLLTEWWLLESPTSQSDRIRFQREQPIRFERRRPMRITNWTLHFVQDILWRWSQWHCWSPRSLCTNANRCRPRGTNPKSLACPWQGRTEIFLDAGSSVIVNFNKWITWQSVSSNNTVTTEITFKTLSFIVSVLLLYVFLLSSIRFLF